MKFVINMESKWMMKIKKNYRNKHDSKVVSLKEGL